ncbi:MAG: peptidyl-prolyl cis-trans isomerase [Oscillospiraceae bacterium]|jgi:hypothetical protein|nr:peptidyl-prolyl cis-trans isomerase [Oscillospiraceae bacterium]
MSASRERKKRQAARAAQAAAPKKRRVDVKRRAVVAVAAGVVGLFAVALVVYSSGVLHKNIKVLTVGGTSLTPAEFNYYHLNAQNSLYDSYSQYGYAWDPTKPLSKQEFYEGMNWLDYINDYVVSQLESMLTRYECAVRDGTRLLPEDTAYIDYAMQSLQTAAEQSGTTPDGFLGQNYGQGLTAGQYKQIITRERLASRWEEDRRAELVYSSEDKERYYSDHKTDFDRVSYHSHTISGTLDDPDATEEDVAAFAEAARASAEEMSSRATAENFWALSLEYSPPPEDGDEPDGDGDEPDDDDNSDIDDSDDDDSDDDDDNDGDDGDDGDEEETDPTLNEHFSYSSVTGDDAKEWLFDDSRKAGDTTVIENSSNFTVYLFLEKSRNEEVTAADTRHILKIFPEHDGDEPTEEQSEATKTAAREVSDAWREKGGTERAFAELAAAESDDTGTKFSGGFYSFTKGDAVAEYNDWTFDPLRREGDAELVKTQYGWHIIYFIGAYENWSAQAQKSLQDTAFTELFEARGAEIEKKQHGFGMFITNLGK